MAETTLDAKAVVRTLHGAFCHDVTGRDLLQLAADKIRDAGQPYTSVYMYMVRGSDLNLEAFSGRETDLTTIPIGSGLCGKAVAERRDIYAADVNADPDYLSCSIETRSEAIALIRRGDEIIGQIDIDSDVPDGFSDAELDALKEVADGLAALL